MLNQALTPLFNKLCAEDGPICWIDRFGGLAKTMVHPSCSLYDPASKILRYPITCNKKGANECFNNGTYLDLVPNDNYKSIVYLHTVGGAVPTIPKNSSLKHAKIITQTVRLVIWANLNQLGIEDCTVMEKFYLDLSKCIDCKTWPSEFKNIGNVKTDILRYNSWEETINLVFKQYNYGDKYQLFLHPYDIGSIDIKVSYLVDPTCLEYQELCKEPIPCTRIDL